MNSDYRATLRDEVDSITDFLISNEGNLTAITQLLLCRNIHNLLTYRITLVLGLILLFKLLY